MDALRRTKVPVAVLACPYGHPFPPAPGAFRTALVHLNLNITVTAAYCNSASALPTGHPVHWFDPTTTAKD